MAPSEPIILRAVASMFLAALISLSNSNPLGGGSSKNKDSEIELLLRRKLWNLGIRYRKNYSKLPGKPDIVITKYKIAIFADSEFWHGYDWENKKNEIKSNRDFWIKKIEGNMKRDIEVTKQLESEGWIVLRFWGKQIKKDLEGCIDIIQDAIRRRVQINEM